MNSNESILLEALKNMLNDKASLGLGQYKKSEEQEKWGGPVPPCNYEYIENMFRLKINKPSTTHFEAISGAFFQTHSYKNLFHPTFDESFNHQMVNMIVPENERQEALKVVSEIRDDLSETEFPQASSNVRSSTTSKVKKGRPDMRDMRKATGHDET